MTPTNKDLREILKEIKNEVCYIKDQDWHESEVVIYSTIEQIFAKYGIKLEDGK